MRIKLLFTEEEYEKLKQCKENGYRTVCPAISCGEIGCDVCPLNGLRIEEQLEYIKNRLEIESNLEPVRHGMWMMTAHFPYKPKSDDERGFHSAMCSECHITQSINIYKGTPQFRYCPYCGAKMDGRKLKNE